MPSKVWGMTRTRAHAIETEDSAQAMLEYENGAFGYVTSSTAEAGTDRRLEIVGDRACLKLVDDELTIVHFDPPLRDHIASSPDLFGQPGTRAELVALKGASESRFHAAHRDFHEAIQGGRPPWCDGKSGIMSLLRAFARRSSLAPRLTIPVRLGRVGGTARTTVQSTTSRRPASRPALSGRAPSDRPPSGVRSGARCSTRRSSRA
jgi:predicted dehydrogenase